MSKDDDIMGFMKGKAKIIGDVEHSIPPENWNSTFDQLDDAGVPDDFAEDRDKEPPPESEDSEPLYDIKPRTRGNHEFSEAADRERRKRNSNDQQRDGTADIDS